MDDNNDDDLDVDVSDLGDEGRVTFTPAQQKKVNQLVAQARQGRRSAQNAQGMTPEAIAALAAQTAVTAALGVMQQQPQPAPRPASASSAPSAAPAPPAVDGIVDIFACTPAQISAMGPKGVRKVLESLAEIGRERSGMPPRPDPKRGR